MIDTRPLREIARQAGILCVSLSMPYDVPTPHGWGVLDTQMPQQYTAPMLLDLTRQDRLQSIMGLHDLQILQRRRCEICPLLVVDPEDWCCIRMVSVSSVRAVVAPYTQVAPAIAAMAELAVTPTSDESQQIWGGALQRPFTPHLSGDFVAIIPALSRAQTLDIAASWCYMSTRSLKRRLYLLRDLYQLRLFQRTEPREWAQTLLDWLSKPDR